MGHSDDTEDLDDTEPGADKNPEELDADNISEAPDDTMVLKPLTLLSASL